MRLRHCTAALALCSLAALPSLTRAQASGNQQPAYTFHAGTRVVLTDVIVTDKQGHPVRGIPQSAFQIYDNNKPQAMASFEEHTTAPVESLPTVSTAQDNYSNAYLAHLPPVLNIIVIDTTNLEIADQMYLNYQLTRFFRALPAGDPVAIYWHTGPTSILLQSFTSNHDLLLAALHKALPHFPPTGREFYSDFATLGKIVADFGQYPGRKNVLWFSGGSTLFLQANRMDVPDTHGWQQVYDELESGRIAIYPMDARGLIAGMVRVPFALWSQHALMNDIAQSTGGRAFYNTNGLGQTAQHWLNDSGDFYTITYAPRNFRVDNRWHKVSVKLSGCSGCTLSYRRGYFADSLADQTPGRKMIPRTLLAADGSASQVPDLHSVPLIFQARVIPAAEAHIDPADDSNATQAPAKKGTISYVVHYLVPLDELTPVAVNGKQQIRFNVTALSFDKNGDVVSRIGTSVSLDVNLVKLRSNPHLVFPFDQRINLRKGDNYLYLAIWDAHTGRLGTLQIPFEATKPK